MENSGSVKKEREINLIDLMVEILLHWRAFIVVMLIGGILFAGVAYVKSYRTAALQLKSQEKEQSEDQKKNDIQGELSEAQLNNIDNILQYEQLYEEKLLYQKKSVLMHIDPYHMPRGELTFLVKSDDIERTYNIQKVYEDMLTSTGLYEYLQEQCDGEDDMNELVTLEKTSYVQVRGTDTVRLMVTHRDEETCNKIMDAIAAYVGQQQEWLNTALGEHQFVLLSRSFGNIMSEDLLEKQNNFTKELESLRNSYIKGKDNFSEEEKNYYNYVKAVKSKGEQKTDEEENVQNESNIDDNQLNKVIKPAFSVKYFIIGMILFMFVHALIIFLLYILNSKLRITDGLQEMYGIPQFGKLSVNQRRKKFLDFIDRWILELRYINQRKFTFEETLDLATAAVKINVKKQTLNQVCFIGCNMSAPLLETCGQMKQRLEAENIKVNILNNVLYDVEALEQLENEQAVVLFETAGYTLYREITEELELLKTQGIKILGGIIIE